MDNDEYILNLGNNMKYCDYGERYIEIIDNIFLFIDHRLKEITIQSKTKSYIRYFDINPALLAMIDPNIKKQLQLKLEEVLINNI
ncbi:MAG: hypothetical protein H7836_08130 [Magnetococcus sp. YQC-3]